MSISLFHCDGIYSCIVEILTNVGTDFAYIEMIRQTRQVKLSIWIVLDIKLVTEDTVT